MPFDVIAGGAEGPLDDFLFETRLPAPRKGDGAVFEEEDVLRRADAVLKVVRDEEHRLPLAFQLL